MARHIRLMGLSSLIIVENREEAEYFLGHPVIDRKFSKQGPLINKLIISGILRQFKYNDHMLLSMRSRNDKKRQSNQLKLQMTLDQFSNTQSWDHSAFTTIAKYISTGKNEQEANSALAYLMVCPFLENTMYDHTKFQNIFSLYKTLSNARRFPGVILSRLTSADLRAKNKLLKLLNGDENGFHAVSVTLDNSLVILQNFRSLVKKEGLNFIGKDTSFRWATLRTAPVTALRQVQEDFSVPFLDSVIPKDSLILIRMKESLGSDANSGFEFASSHWSFCPAHKYILRVFETLWLSLNNTKTAEKIS